MAISDLEPGTPEWWLPTLEAKLKRRNRKIKIYGDYFNGKHNLRHSSEGFTKEFLDFLKGVRDNWCEPVVDATHERLKVQGIRWGEEESRDKDAWVMWQTNRLDAEAPILLREMLIYSEASMLVNPFVETNEYPEITVEHPTQMIVAHAAGSRWKRAAAFKTFSDDYGDTWAYLYLPDWIYRFRARRKGDVRQADDRFGSWIPHQGADNTWPLHNPLEDVPVVPFYNRARMIDPPQSEIHNVIPNQDLVNMFLRHEIVASEFLSWRQRYITGEDLSAILGRQPDADEETEALDAESPQAEAPPVNVGQDRLMTIEGQDLHIGEFSAADLKNYIEAIQDRIQSIASQSRTPPHYFYLSGQFPSGETIKSAETGLVKKVTGKMDTLGESFEEVIRLGFRAMGDPRGFDMTAETIWGDPESRTESEMVDAAVKLKSIGVEEELLWERVGMTQSQIARNKTLREARRMNEELFGVPVPAEPALA